MASAAREQLAPSAGSAAGSAAGKGFIPNFCFLQNYWLGVKTDTTQTLKLCFGVGLTKWILTSAISQKLARFIEVIFGEVLQ